MNHATTVYKATFVNEEQLQDNHCILWIFTYYQQAMESIDHHSPQSKAVSSRTRSRLPKAEQMRLRRASKTEEQRRIRLEKDASRKQNKRAAETDQQVSAHCQTDIHSKNWFGADGYCFTIQTSTSSVFHSFVFRTEHKQIASSNLPKSKVVSANSGFQVRTIVCHLYMRKINIWDQSKTAGNLYR